VGEKFYIDHVSSKKSSSDRSNILTQFASADQGLISNARCLTEGVNVPCFDMVMFVDPKQSVVDIIQAVGRVLRPKKGKELAYIVIPVFHKSIGDHTEIDESSYSHFLPILQAMSSVDSRLKDEIIQKAKDAKGARKKLERLPIHKFDVPSIDCIDIPLNLNDKLFFETVEKVALSWEYRISILKDFVFDKQKTDVFPEDYCGVNLKRFVAYARGLFTKGILAPDRIEEFNNLKIPLKDVSGSNSVQKWLDKNQEVLSHISKEMEEGGLTGLMKSWNKSGLTYEKYTFLKNQPKPNFAQSFLLDKFGIDYRKNLIHVEIADKSYVDLIKFKSSAIPGSISNEEMAKLGAFASLRYWSVNQTSKWPLDAYSILDHKDFTLDIYITKHLGFENLKWMDLSILFDVIKIADEDVMVMKKESAICYLIYSQNVYQDSYLSDCMKQITVAEFIKVLKFAKKLDKLAINGNPVMPGTVSRRQWAQVVANSLKSFFENSYNEFSKNKEFNEIMEQFVDKDSRKAG
jgi:hypothetical protein